MKNIIFIFWILKNYCLDIIEIPFESKKSENYLPNRFLSQYYDINLYTKIEIGSNNQQLELPIKLNKYITYITSSALNNLKSLKFDEKKSSSYKKIDDNEFKSKDNDFISGYKSSDNIKIGNKNINKFKFYLSNNQIIDESGTLGLKVQPISSDMKIVNDTGIIKQLKEENLISSYYFYFKFDKSKNLGEYKGKLIIGGLPHEIESSKFDKSKFINTKIQKNIFNTTWDIYFMKINYGNDLVSEQFSISFSSTFGLIHAPIFFKKKIYEKFFYQENCYEEFNGYFNYFCCNEKVDIKQFKQLYFESLYQELNFTLNYEDLFYKIDKKNYFLILFNNDIYTWQFGLNFLYRYTLVFNTDKKIIGYYFNQINKNENRKIIILYILLIIFSIVIIFLITYIYYLLPLRKRKIKANELDEEFDYTPKLI
jgi:hypothetical protein